MSDDNKFGDIIAILEARYIEALKAADEKLAALNAVRQEAGLAPRSPGTDAVGDASGMTLTQIKRDTFYGKKQMTAVREYLGMRRIQGNGPATPREILDALTAGGYQFDSKSEVIALVGLRALLRKANTVFHKLPDGSYGLLAWYPDAKPTKDNEDEPEPVKRKLKTKKRSALRRLKKALADKGSDPPKKRGRPPILRLPQPVSKPEPTGFEE